MKSLLTVMGIGFAIVAIGATASAQNPPREIAGYRLGSNITVYGGRIASENAYAVRLRPYLKEAAVSVPQGFASGYVSTASVTPRESSCGLKSSTKTTAAPSSIGFWRL